MTLTQIGTTFAYLPQHRFISLQGSMAANKKNFDMQIKLLMIGDSGRLVFLHSGEG